MKKVIPENATQPNPPIELNPLDKYQVHSRVKVASSQNRESASHCDYGMLNQYKLDDLINLQGDGFSQRTVVRLAFIENHSIHLQEAAIQIFEKYAKNEIALTAIYGKSGSGKSLLLDKLINLTEVEGSYFTRNSQLLKGIYLWSIPFSRNNLKVFLLDIDGYQDEIDDDYLMLLSFLLFLSSSLILVSSPSDLPFEELNPIFKQLKKCKKYFICKDETEFDAVWPPNLYLLFRASVSESRTIESLRGLFKTFNFKVISNAMEDKYAKEFTDEDLKEVSMRKYNARKKMLSESYIGRISGLFRHVHSKVGSKSLMKFRFTGANLVKLAINAVQSLNIKGHLQIDKICSRSMKELYVDAYNFHTQLYNEHLAEYLNDEKPFEVDYLINAFKDSHELIFKSFNNLTICPELKKAYSDKLEKYINEKEKMILAINKKKSNNQVKEVILPVKPQIAEINQFIKEAKHSPKHFEQVYTSNIVPYIATAIKDVELQRKKIEDKETKVKKDIIQSKITEKQSQLKELKKNKDKQSSVIQESFSRKQYFDTKQKQLNEALQKLRQQLAQAKSAESQRKDAQKQKNSEQLLLEEQKLKKEVKMKQKTILQLKSQPDLPGSHEQIELLASQIEQKVMKQRQLESALASNIPKLQSIQTFRSSSKIGSPRKVQSRVFKSESPNIRIISSPKT